jgi:hypothetical protein
MTQPDPQQPEPSDPRLAAHNWIADSDSEDSGAPVDAAAADKGDGNGKTSGNGNGKPGDGAGDTLVNAWSQLKKQQSEFDRRSEVLDGLRQRLSKHIDGKNRVLLDRQRALDIKKQQSDREQQYLDDAKQHLKRSRKAESAELQRLKARQRELEAREREVREESQRSQNAVADTSRSYEDQIHNLLEEKQAMELRIEAMERRTPVEAAPQSRRSLLVNWRFGAAMITAMVAAGLVWVQTDFVYRLIVPVVAIDAPTHDELSAQRVALAVALQDLPDRADVSVSTAAHTLDVVSYSAQPDNLAPTLSAKIELHLESQRRVVAPQPLTDPDALAAVDSQLQAARVEFEELVTRLADEALSDSADNPREELQRLDDRMRSARAAYDQVRGEIDRTRIEVDRVQNTAPEASGEVDPNDLFNAEDADSQLHQDREELRFHMRRLRDHLLEAFIEFPDKVERFAGASQELTSFLQTERLNVTSAATMSSLDAMQSRCEQLTRLILEFERHWSKQADTLKRLLVDPRKQNTLHIQTRIEKLVRDLMFDSGEELKAMQESHQKYLRSLSNRAEHFTLTTSLKDNLEGVLQHQYAFATLANRVIPKNNIQLDTIMHRVTGLARRVRDRQTSIAEGLQAENHRELESQRQTRLAALQSTLTELGVQRQAHLDDILEVQDALLELSPVLEEHGVNITLRRVSEEQKTALATRIAELETQRSALANATAPPPVASHARFEVGSPQIAEWPHNTVERLSQVGSIAILTTLLVYLALAGLIRQRPALLTT